MQLKKVCFKYTDNHWPTDNSHMKNTDTGMNYVIANLYYTLNMEGEGVIAWIGNCNYMEHVLRDAKKNGAFMESLVVIENAINTATGSSYTPSAEETGQLYLGSFLLGESGFSGTVGTNVPSELIDALGETYTQLVTCLSGEGEMEILEDKTISKNTKDTSCEISSGLDGSKIEEIRNNLQFNIGNFIDNAPHLAKARTEDLSLGDIKDMLFSERIPTQTIDDWMKTLTAFSVFDTQGVEGEFSFDELMDNFDQDTHDIVVTPLMDMKCGEFIDFYKSTIAQV